MKKLALKLIDWYQKEISPKRNKRCRYTPSCSEYAKTAFLHRNFFVACFLTLGRILRCNPLFKGGYDPVPLSRKERKAEEKKKFGVDMPK